MAWFRGVQGLFVFMLALVGISVFFACSKIGSPKGGTDAAALSSIEGAISFDSNAIYQSVIASVTNTAVGRDEVKKAINLPIAQLYDRILRQMPEQKAIMVNGKPLGNYRDLFIKNKASILKMYGNKSLSQYLTGRGIQLGDHFTFSDIQTALDLVENQDQWLGSSANLGLTLNCESLAYSGDALSIAGAILAIACVIPGINAIACPVAGIVFGVGSAAVGIVDVAGCHREGEANVPDWLSRMRGDQAAIDQNKASGSNTTLCSIDAPLATYLNNGAACPTNTAPSPPAVSSAPIQTAI